ncbi:MAG: hypothetical protein R3E12_20280 [Candidatus Eisenbacteria bacterium]
MEPDAGSGVDQYHHRAQHANVPINNATVVVSVGAEHDALWRDGSDGRDQCFRPGRSDPGRRGCAHNVANYGLVSANGVTIRRYSNCKSPDYDGASATKCLSRGPHQFSSEFLDNAPNECHDYDNNANTGLEDVIIFGTPFTSAASCAP